MYHRIDDSEGDMATGEASTWGGWFTSQLNIVLLGGRNSGKSTVGNFLLGKEEFVTKERTSCTRRLGLVAGRRLMVVDTPGWWCDFSAQDTSELVKREIRRSVSLCSPPGPHVFLLTVKASSAFSEKRRRAVEEHVGLLGEQVWSHCVVVFTSSNHRSRHSGAEKEEGEEAWGWLRDKCGQRCHSVVLSDGDDVTELLDKIHRLITENGNRVFEMEQKILQAAVEERRGVEERAQRRVMRVKRRRALMQERSRPVTSIRMVLVGAKGSGKTSALNTILGRDGAPPLRRTAQCVVGEGVMFGRQLTVVDTPGWWMNYFSEDSTVFDQREMVVSLSLCPPGPHVFLLVIRVDRAFTETYRRAAQEHLQLISERIWSRVVVVFTFGDWLGDTTTEQLIESEGEPLRWLLDRCGDRYHVLNNKTRGDGFQVRELIGKIEEMLTGGDSYHYYEIERNVMEQLEARMRGERERVKERLMRKERQRQMARSQLAKLHPLPELRVVLIGGRRTGKSSCGNTILSREIFHTDTHTTYCTEARGKVSGRTVTVLDTPGGLPVTSDLLGDPSRCALLLVVNVSSSFRDAHREELEKQLEAGDQMWSRALVLFSYGDWLGDTSIEQRIESEGAPLQRLVDRCGNRYHILDNKRRGDEAQVAELVELVEEMLARERVADLHRGDHVWRSVSAASCDTTELTSSTTQTSHCCSGGGGRGGEGGGGGGAGGQIVAAGRGERTGLTTADRDGFLPFLSSLLSGNRDLRWMAAGQQSRVSVALPSWFPPDDDSHGSLRLNGESRRRPFSPTHPTMVLILPQTQNRMLMEENTTNVQTLCHPVLRERTLRRLSERGGLQQLLERWGDSSLEELEAFIDTYFERVWEQTMGSFQEAEADSPASEQDAAGGGAEEEEEVLSSIDRKLSKLDLLEEIRSELSELRESLEHSWTTIQELRDKSQQEPSDTC